MKKKMEKKTEKDELEFGPVLILKGPHKGKLGLYDDNEEWESPRSAIVYLVFEDGYRMFNPLWLASLDKIDLFRISMWKSIKKSVKKMNATEESKKDAKRAAAILFGRN